MLRSLISRSPWVGSPSKRPASLASTQSGVATRFSPSAHAVLIEVSIAPTLSCSRGCTASRLAQPASLLLSTYGQATSGLLQGAKPEIKGGFYQRRMRGKHKTGRGLTQQCSTHLVSKVSASSFPSSVASSCTIGDVPTAGQIPSFPGDPAWFLHPSAWTMAYHYQPPASLPSGTVFSNFIRGLQTWLSRFLCAGHNPFIHRHLYSETGMPQGMRDAYSAIAVSQDVTQGNEHIVDDISSSHISNLLACQPTDGPLSLLLLSTREHLARTQALLIHLLLALFSPSIPRRAKAESLIETLLHWTNQLWESASQDAAAALLVRGVLPLPDGEDGFTPDSTSGLYQTFILTESIRRTWLLCNIATGVYYSHKGDWSSTCAGDIYITARAELWDASSSARWEAAVRQQDPLFVYSLHGRSLVARGVSASEVDEFARHLFTIMWGLDKVEDWVVRTGDSVSIMY